MDAAELEWIAWTTPITTSLRAALAASDFSGRTVACPQHILADTICILTPLVEAGARVRLATTTTDRRRHRLGDGCDMPTGPKHYRIHEVLEGGNSWSTGRSVAA